MPRGKGVRCAGWVSDDGRWAHCSREDLAGHAKFHAGSVTYSHALSGRCPCGEVHGEESSEDAERRRRAAPERSSRKPSGRVHQIGEAAGARVVAEYDYRNRDGRLLYQVLRKEPKTFLQRRPCQTCNADGKTPGRSGRDCGKDCKGGWLWSMTGQKTTLFHIPELFAGLLAGDTVWIAEGEKDVLALEAAGAVATCNTGGAGKWRDELAEPFRQTAGDRVVVVQDIDEPHKLTGKRAGAEHAREIVGSLAAVLPPHVSVEIVEAAEGHDAADHLAAGKTLEEFVKVWPLPEVSFESNPAAWKRQALRLALEQPAAVLERIPQDTPRENQPLFPCGVIAGGDKLRWLQGVTCVSGAPSAGKSYFAISTAIDACLAGWEVFYLSAEMHRDLILDRAARALVSAGSTIARLVDGWEREDLVARLRSPVTLPENFVYLNVNIGVTLSSVLDYLASEVTERPSLVVFDSLSSFVDQMESGKRGRDDAFGMGDLRDVMRWIVSVRRLTHGRVSALLLSELNKEGRAKGRFVDHRSDLAISMVSDPDHDTVKKIVVTKSWWGPTGSAGDFVLDWEIGRLRRLPGD